MSTSEVSPSTATASSPRPPARSGFDRAIAVIGELFIAAGVLLALFVVWQLFYTDVQADREQQEIIDDLAWVQDTAPITAGNGNTDEVEIPDVVQTIPAEFQYRDIVPTPMDEPAHAATFAAMYVPRWGEDYIKPISQGISRRDVLDKLGIGHYPHTAMPGALGNFAVAGHRTTYGKPFSGVADLQVGDTVAIQTEAAWYVYKITDWEIVGPREVSVIAPVPGQPGVAPDNRYITLTTCHPKYSAAQRWVVHGELDYWAPTGHGLPPEIVEGV